MRAVSKVCLVMVLALASSACVTLRAEQPDAKAGNAAPAHVIGDYHVRAGALVNVFLRSVDDQHLHFWQHAADIDAGLHRLLVDCSVVATQKLSRHELNVSLEAGVRYRLTAEANDQQGCTRVTLEELE
jgi:hypothetical protein